MNSVAFMRLFSWLKNWISRPSDRRRAIRYSAQRFTAFYWDGAAPLGHETRDISDTGIYLCTTDRWYPGTVITLTLKVRVEDDDVSSELAISVHSKVVRYGDDGVGMQFVWSKPEERNAFRRFIRQCEKDIQ